MRIYAEPSDQMLKEINQAVKEKGIGKTQIVLEAIDQYLHGSDQGETAQVKAELNKAHSDLNQSQDEITRLKVVITSIEADFNKERSLVEELQIKNDHLEKTSDHASSDLEILKRDHQHFKDTLDMKDKQITFLEGHVSQLVQLALPPSEEEAKKKGWSWKF